MPLAVGNSRKEVAENSGWFYSQGYDKDEDRATEALFKWFFFSDRKIQNLFLSRICGVRISGLRWQRLNLQPRGKKGVPDAVLLFADDSKLLFEIKIKQKSVHRGQLRHQLHDAGLKMHGKQNTRPPKLVLITPDFREPVKISDMPQKYCEAIIWVSWHEIMHFLAKLNRLNSSGKLIRNGLLLFLKNEIGLKKYAY